MHHMAEVEMSVKKMIHLIKTSYHRQAVASGLLEEKTGWSRREVSAPAKEVPSGYVKIASDNRHLWWIYQLNIVSFNSFVSLPEGSHLACYPLTSGVQHATLFETTKQQPTMS